MPQNPSDAPSPAHFPTTRWSLVLQAGDPHAPLAQESLAELCGSYWYPLYAYIRRRGYDPEQARDLTQDFFARALEKGLLGEADPSSSPLKNPKLDDPAAGRRRDAARVAQAVVDDSLNGRQFRQKFSNSAPLVSSSTTAVSIIRRARDVMQSIRRDHGVGTTEKRATR